MNPRQRRGVLLIVLALLGLVGVFALVSSYVADVRSEVGPKIQLLTFARDVRAQQPFGDDDLRRTSIPERYVPPNALRDSGALAGLVAAADYPQGSIVQRGMAEAAPALSPGEREIAILVDAETGVAGKIGPDATVDIVATFAGDDQGSPPRAQVLVPGARIIAVGQLRQRGGQGDGAVSSDPTQVVPVTFALSVRQLLKVTAAESFAQEVRLALLRPGARSVIPRDKRTFSPVP